MRIIFNFLLFSVILISCVPFYDSVDKAGNQWLFLSVINAFLFFNVLPNIKINILNHNTYLAYFSFISLAFISLLFSSNINLSIHDLSRHVTSLIFLSLLIFSLKVFKPSFILISGFFICALVVESLSSLSPIFFDYTNGIVNNFQYENFRIDSLVGLTGNRNITTAAIIVKLPFLFFVFLHTKNYFFKGLSLLIFIFPILSLFLIGSRTALLSLFLVFFILSIYFLLYKRSLNGLAEFLFLILPFIFSFIFSKHILPSSSQDMLDRVNSIEISNESSSNRFVLWENALDQITNSPFMGVGIGNWKIESAAYWGSLGENYLVPYHAHNDFLEFSTELGVLGGFLYFSIFFFSLISLWKLFKIQRLCSLILFFSLLAYLVDSCLNFPFERPIMQVPFLICMSLVIVYTAKPDYLR